MCDSCDNLGGAGSPFYNNGYNTMGVGDVCIPGGGSCGSGDLFGTPVIPGGKKPAMKKGADQSMFDCSKPLPLYVPFQK